MITSIEIIAAKVKALAETNPTIHMNVILTSPRITLENVQAKIVGVYPHIFQIEETSSGSVKRHTLQYTDILIGNVTIAELAL